MHHLILTLTKEEVFIININWNKEQKTKRRKKGNIKTDRHNMKEGMKDTMKKEHSS
jgi:hypothetical protein